MPGRKPAGLLPFSLRVGFFVHWGKGARGVFVGGGGGEGGGGRGGGGLMYATDSGASSRDQIGYRHDTPTSSPSHVSPSPPPPPTPNPRVVVTVLQRHLIPAALGTVLRPEPCCVCLIRRLATVGQTLVTTDRLVLMARALLCLPDTAACNSWANSCHHRPSCPHPHGPPLVSAPCACLVFYSSLAEYRTGLNA